MIRSWLIYGYHGKLICGVVCRIGRWSLGCFMSLLVVSFGTCPWYDTGHVSQQRLVILPAVIRRVFHFQSLAFTLTDNQPYIQSPCCTCANLFFSNQVFWKYPEWRMKKIEWKNRPSKFQPSSFFLDCTSKLPLVLIYTDFSPRSVSWFFSSVVCCHIMCRTCEARSFLLVGHMWALVKNWWASLPNNSNLLLS